ncbi:MAG: DUF1579 domain-containing protein [Proteobacteria bacterium]|nr:DUF1579 domain-containing protein [Pseudomonadota bacterium]MCP4916767.1 DUF1579 domain-containing protein [Pseudomonadota bacterium]
MPISSQRAAELLSDLAFLVGEWRITGTVHGAPVEGTATARLVLDGTWLEYREVIDGYEDLCLYGVDRETGDRVVHHFTSEGLVDVHVVLPLDGGGFHWVPVGLGPIVRVQPDDAGWTCSVGRFESAELDVELTYR